jgi:hypothetical protein
MKKENRFTRVDGERAIVLNGFAVGGIIAPVAGERLNCTAVHRMPRATPRLRGLLLRYDRSHYTIFPCFQQGSYAFVCRQLTICPLAVILLLLQPDAA